MTADMTADATARSIAASGPVSMAREHELLRIIWRGQPASRSRFGIFAATLGAIGLYVVLAYAVKHREHEIAVRIAVGATGGDIARMVVRDGAWVVLAGLVVGVVGAMAIGRLLRSQLFGVSPQDAMTLAGSTVLLVLVSLAAIWWPARRASRTDPVIALKAE